MGYSVSIVNTSKPDAGLLGDLEKVKVALEPFGFFEEIDGKTGEPFFYKESPDQDLVLFYSSGELWANTTSDVLISIMIDIARAFGDGARVRNEEGETYVSLEEAYVHEDDKSDYFSSEVGRKIYFGDVMKYLFLAVPILFFIFLLIKKNI